MCCGLAAQRQRPGQPLLALPRVGLRLPARRHFKGIRLAQVQAQIGVLVDCFGPFAAVRVPAAQVVGLREFLFPMQQDVLLLVPSSTLCVEFLSALLQYHRAEPDEPFHCCLGYFAGSKTRVGLLDLH